MRMTTNFNGVHLLRPILSMDRHGYGWGHTRYLNNEAGGSGLIAMECGPVANSVEEHSQFKVSVSIKVLREYLLSVGSWKVSGDHPHMQFTIPRGLRRCGVSCLQHITARTNHKGTCAPLGSSCIEKLGLVIIGQKNLLTCGEYDANPLRVGP